ncbi:MAG: trypsin-like peptidase domain-containing protein [Corynebacterium sp.]|nr:trypsin-like peptidase domain-containing protein [Corynebacterium sp.]
MSDKNINDNNPYASQSRPGEAENNGNGSAASNSSTGGWGGWGANNNANEQTQEIPVTATTPGAPAFNGQPVGEAGASPYPQMPEQGKHEKPRRAGVPVAMVCVSTLVAAIIGGGVGGYVVHNASDKGGSNSNVTSSLTQPVAAKSTSGDGSVETVAAKVLPSVVSIRVVTQQASDEGSGSIISSDGKVLTNNHVVADAINNQNAQVTVTLNDGTSHNAHVIAGDASTDVAVVQIEGVSNLPVISFGDSSQLAVGQGVVAIGSPLGLSSTVTSGIVSALNRPVRASGETTGQSSLIDAIQTDAAINPGNSGGPLVDMDGNLIGMNSVIASTGSSDSGQSGSIGLGFAIPSNLARKYAQQLIDTGKVTQPMIGVRVQQTSQYEGALVAQVDDGPASQAGITQGDLIVGVNDRNIDSADALIAAIRSYNVGDTVTLKVKRPDSDDVRTVQVTLASSGSQGS